MRDPNSLEHYGVLGMKWGIRRYQPYTDGKKGIYIGPKAKYTKEENRTRKDLVRGVTAAQKNLVDKEKVAETAENVLTRAERENRHAHEMVVLPWNRSKKRELITETERYVREAMKDLEIPRADVERATKYATTQIKKIKEFQNQMNKKYGTENIKQLKLKDHIVLYEEGSKYVNHFIKVGINMANFPIIGNFVAANYIVDWEAEDRKQLSKKRAQSISSNTY